MKYFVLILLMSLSITTGCEQNDLLPGKGYQEVTLKDLTGFDGCGWVLEKSEGDYLEPVNLGDFVPNGIDGNRYLIKYKLVENRASICMVGLIIEILELKPATK